MCLSFYPSISFSGVYFREIRACKYNCQGCLVKHYLSEQNTGNNQNVYQVENGWINNIRFLL